MTVTDDDLRETAAKLLDGEWEIVDGSFSRRHGIKNLARGVVRLLDENAATRLSNFDRIVLMAIRDDIVRYEFHDVTRVALLDRLIGDKVAPSKE